MDSIKAFLTVVFTVVNESVLVSTSCYETDLQTASATSEATFFSMRESANCFKMGSTSSAAKVLLPVMFWKALVSLEKRPP